MDEQFIKQFHVLHAKNQNNLHTTMSTKWTIYRTIVLDIHEYQIQAEYNERHMKIVPDFNSFI
jgi:hypothetical protein